VPCSPRFSGYPLVLPIDLGGAREASLVYVGLVVFLILLIMSIGVLYQSLIMFMDGCAAVGGAWLGVRER